MARTAGALVVAGLALLVRCSSSDPGDPAEAGGGGGALPDGGAGAAGQGGQGGAPGGGGRGGIGGDPIADAAAGTGGRPDAAVDASPDVVDASSDVRDGAADAQRDATQDGADAATAFRPPPLAYYPFDAVDSNGSVAVDVVGSHDGTIIGATLTQGVAGEALDFDGVDDYVELDPFPELGQEMTVSGWARLDVVPATPANPAIIEKWDWPNGLRCFYLGFVDHDLAGGVSQDGSLNDINIIGEGQDVPLSVWIHGLFTYDGLVVRLFRDGTLVSESIPYPSQGPIFQTIDVDVWIGRSRSNGSPEQTLSWFEGTIDEVAVWDRVLTDSQIREVHSRGLSGQRLD